MGKGGDRSVDALAGILFDLADLIALDKTLGVEYKEDEYKTALPLIKTQLKALIARDLWDMNEYFQVINSMNETVQKGLELIDD